MIIQIKEIRNRYRNVGKTQIMGPTLPPSPTFVLICRLQTLFTFYDFVSIDIKSFRRKLILIVTDIQNVYGICPVILMYQCNYREVQIQCTRQDMRSPQTHFEGRMRIQHVCHSSHAQHHKCHRKHLTKYLNPMDRYLLCLYNKRKHKMDFKLNDIENYTYMYEHR